MLDVGWSEMAIVAVVALFVIGPKELPRALRMIGRYAGKIKAVAREFQDSIDDAVREAELDDVKKQIESVGKMNFGKSISDTIDPEGEIEKGMNIPKSILGAPSESKPSEEEAEPEATPETADVAMPTLADKPVPATPPAAEEAAEADTSKAGA
jgi:sec-independent protein translocase protein TatB